jgi:hypothetical protein
MILCFSSDTCKACPFRISYYHEDECLLYFSGAKATKAASIRTLPVDCPFKTEPEITVKRSCQ